MGRCPQPATWRFSRPRFRAVAAIAALWLATSSVSGQGTELRATWRDLETWSRPAGSGQTDRGLGLHLSGSAGTVMVAFLVRSTSRGTTSGDVTVQVSTGPLVNPNRVQTATLVFRGTGQNQQRFSMDLSSRLTVDNPAPGAQVTSGVGRMRAADYERLSRATAVTATVLGLEVAVRPDQLEAMRALSEK